MRHQVLDIRSKILSDAQDALLKVAPRDSADYEQIPATCLAVEQSVETVRIQFARATNEDHLLDRAQIRANMARELGGVLRLLAGLCDAIDYDLAEVFQLALQRPPAEQKEPQEERINLARR